MRDLYSMDPQPISTQCEPGKHPGPANLDESHPHREKWAGQCHVVQFRRWARSLSRSRPYKKNDQATIESKNNHLVRNHGFYYRYDTDPERVLLNRLWQLVNDRLSYLIPTTKPIGFGSDRNSHRKLLYCMPRPAGPTTRLRRARADRADPHDLACLYAAVGLAVSA
jgi:hypothetical protein